MRGGGREGKKECNKELKDATSWFRIFMLKERAMENEDEEKEVGEAKCAV